MISSDVCVYLRVKTKIHVSKLFSGPKVFSFKNKMLSFAERKCSHPKGFWSSFADWIVNSKDVLNHSVCVVPLDLSVTKYLLIFVTALVAVRTVKRVSKMISLSLCLIL